MSRSSRITYGVGAVVGFLALVVVAALLIVDVGAQKSRFEKTASEALGMDVTVGGRSDIGFFPGLHVTLEDVQIRNRGMDVVAAKRADLGIDFLRLLLLKVRLTDITLERYRISIERDINGKFNYETAGVLPAVDLVNVFLSDGTLHYANKQAGGGFEARHCRLAVSHLRHPGGRRGELLKALSLTGDFVCREMKTEDLTLSDLKSPINGKDGIFEFEPVTMQVFGSRGSGRVHLDHTGAVPRVRVRYTLPKFRIEEFLKTLSSGKPPYGPMDFSANLSMQGTTMKELTQTAEGEASLAGEDLTLEGRDLDKELARYKSSQNFNLVDLGAFFFAGPVGLAVTKGYDFTRLFQGSGGSTRIQTLVSNWKVERGVAHAQDVALTTKKNRLALQGGLDFVNQVFQDVTIAVIDAKGCPTVRQKIHGPFAKPIVDKPNFLTSLAGPALKLLKQVRKILPGAQCESFYEGSVKPPK